MHPVILVSLEYWPPGQGRVILPEPQHGREFVRHDDGVDEFPSFQVQRTSEMEGVQSPQSMSRAIRLNEFFCHFVVTHPEGLHAKPAQANILGKTPENQRPTRAMKSLRPAFSGQAPNAFPVRRGVK
jgi:hypothetical protein